MDLELGRAREERFVSAPSNDLTQYVDIAEIGGQREVEAVAQGSLVPRYPSSATRGSPAGAPRR